MEAEPARVRAAVCAYRHVTRGLVPPPEVWNAALGGTTPRPPVVSAPALVGEFALSEERLRQRLEQRQEALRVVPPGLPPDVQLTLALERPLTGLRALQRRVRAGVSAVADGSAMRADAEESLSLRRVRRARLPRELREVERIERKRQFDADVLRKRRRELFLARLTSHHDEFRAFHREARKSGGKLAKAVLASFEQKERRENKEAQRERRERLRALRENNIDEYMKLVTDSKNERITQLLEETDRYLSELSAKVSEQKEHTRSVGGGHASEPAPSGGAASSEGGVGGASTETYSERSAYYRSAHAVTEAVISQPAMLVGGTLKEYQMAGLRWLVSLHNNELNGILADEMGLGKTIQTIALISYLIESKGLAGPYLVIVPLATLSNWQLEMRKWAPAINLVAYKGSPDVRREIYDSQLVNWGEGPPRFNVLLTTYELVMKDKQRLKRFQYAYIVVDEGHRMKNAASKLSATLLQYEAAHRLLLTGTPLQNSLHELWALLNFMLPKIFSSADSFEQWFAAPIASAGGTAEDVEIDEEERLLVINRLHQVLRPFLLRRLKSEVEAQLPGKAEYVVKCELSEMQRVIYRQVQEQGLCAVGEGGQLRVSGLNNVEMQLRKVCNHPYLLISDDHLANLPREMIWRSSGKFELLERILPKLKALGHRVLIFSQMVQLMNLLEDFLNLLGHAHLRLDGTTKGEERGELIRRFNAPDSPYFIFMLSTRAGGLGLNLQSADTVVLFDSDWNPQMDLQAMARAHRIGQAHEVRVLRLVTASPIEEKILATATDKLNSEAMVIGAGKFNQTSDASERREMLQKIIAQSADEQEDAGIPTDADINVLMARPNSALGLTQDEEVERYNAMDAARGVGSGSRPASRASDGSSGGAAVSRLATHGDLPEWMVAAEAMRVEQREADASGGGALLDGRRERKRVSYGGMSDGDFNKMLRAGMEEEEFMERKRELAEAEEVARRQTGSETGALRVEEPSEPGAAVPKKESIGNNKSSKKRRRS